MYKFLNTTYKAYITLELLHETTACDQQVAALMSKSGAPAAQKSIEHKCKEFNFQTYKYHALEDYVDTIQEQGTIDNYST